MPRYTGPAIVDPFEGVPTTIEPSASQGYAAGMELNNPAVRFLRGAADYAAGDEIALERMVEPVFKNVDGFIPSDHLEEGESLADFAEVGSPDEMDFQRRKIARNETLQQQASGFGNVAGAVTNPVTLGAGFATGGLSLGAELSVIAGAEVVSEWMLHNQQPRRTATESALNVTMSGFATVAGAGATRYFSNKGVKQATDAFAEQIDDTVDISSAVIEKSMGAAEVATTTIEQETLTAPKGLNWFVDKMAGISPVGRVMTKSSSVKARQIMQEIDEVPYVLQKHKEGIASPQSFRIRSQASETADTIKMVKSMNDVYDTYAKAGGELSMDEFSEQVARTMFSGDVHIDPAVERAAKFFRPYADTRYKEAIERGLFGDDVLAKFHETGELPKAKGAKSYFPRMYDRAKILKHGEYLQGKLAAKFRRILDKPSSMVTVVDDSGSYGSIPRGDIDAFKLENPSGRIIEPGGMTEDTITKLSDDAAADIIKKMKGGEVDLNNSSLDSIIPKAGSLNERTMFMLSDEELSPVMEMDALKVMVEHNRSMIQERELVDMFGTRDINEILEPVTKEYDDMIKAARKAGDVKQVGKLEQEMKDTLADMSVVLQRNTGGRNTRDPFSAVSTAADYIKVYNTSTLLTGTFFTNLADTVSGNMRHGFEGMDDVFRPLWSRASKLSREEAQIFGLAGESVTGKRLAGISEVSATRGLMIGGKYGDTVAKLTDPGHVMNTFGKVSGLNMLTDFTQTAAVMRSQNIWAKKIGKFASLPQKQKIRFLDVGIDEAAAKQIDVQFQKYGEWQDEVFLSNISKWDDLDAAQTYKNAMFTEVEKSILVPSGAIKPKWFDESDLGGLLSQYMQFPALATQRFLVQGLQRSDAEALAGFVSLSVMGAMVTAIKDGARGKDLTQKTTADWVINGISRGGALGYVEMPFGTAVAAAAHFGGADIEMSKYVGRPERIFSSAFPTGPQIGPLVSAATSATKIATGDGNEKDTAKLLVSIPMLNLFHGVDLLMVAKEGPGWRDK